MNDKTLAEFIIALHEDSKSLQEFKTKLNDVGADFPESFVENLDRLILSMHPKHKKANGANGAGKGKGKESEGAFSEKEKHSRMFPGLALPDKDWEKPGWMTGGDGKEKDATDREVDDLMSQLEGVGKKKSKRPTAADLLGDDEPISKRRRSASPPARRDDRNGGDSRYGGDRDRDRGRYGDDSRGRRDTRGALDERPVLYKIYDGKVSSMKDFGAFVTLEGVMGRAEGAFTFLVSLFKTLIFTFLHVGMVHISMIQQGGGRVNSVTDLLSRGQAVKVKVMSMAGTRLGLSIKDVDQRTGQDLSPHLRIKTEAELREEERQQAARSSSGANAVPLNVIQDSSHSRSAKRLTSPERWEIKQLIASGAVDASEYPNLDEDFASPMARAEVEEELDVEVREDEPSFLAGQTKKTLDLSPVKIVKAPDGSLNRAAMAGAALAKERREMRQQEVNDQADAEARDFSTPWLDPMAQTVDKVFAQDLRGRLAGQGETSAWQQQTFNKATTFGKITSLSIQDQRKSLPIYKLRDPLLDAIRQVLSPVSIIISRNPVLNSYLHLLGTNPHRRRRYWLWKDDSDDAVLGRSRLC